MIDFKINASGDIALAPARQYPVLRIDFYRKQYPCLRLDFDTDVLRYDLRPYGCRLDFHTNVRNIPYDKITAVPVTDKAETSQEILIRLKTELGEFEALPALGSKLVLERHHNILSETVQEQVRQYAEEAIGDVAFGEEPVVTVTRADDDESRFRHETLKITIDTGDTTCFEDTI